MHVRQTKSSSDQAAIAKQPAHVIGARIGGDIEVLGLTPQKQIAHTATHHVGLEAGVLQPIQHFERVFADVASRDAVIRARDDGGRMRKARKIFRNGHLRIAG
jgi:hypothetical protein